MGKADAYRLNAASCLMLVEKTRDPRREFPEPQQPVVQQQQQIQPDKTDKKDDQ
jgi:hypothetical protein